MVRFLLTIVTAVLAPLSARADVVFDRDVLPILKANCWKCHGEGKRRGGLDLTSRAGLLQGGDLGPAIHLEKLEQSRLLKAVRYQDGLEMPPTGKLRPEQIDTLTRWVKAGAPWGRESAPTVKAPEPPKGGGITAEARNAWPYRPVQRPPVPPVKTTGWGRTPVDAFILAGLEAKGLTPAAPADKVALVRRAYYDLTGLPPTPEQIDAFVKDTADDAFDRLIDTLLASPRYGEKWARHWLDLVRYAETNGYERDGPKPNVWRFRDYVIQSFNTDKPFDRFIKEQLAGDEIDRENAECVIASGYYRLGTWDDEPVDPLQARADEIDDWVATTAQVFLGMTMNCARCHDHKIDPISQADYYRLAAFFEDIPRFSESRDTKSRFNQTDITPKAERLRYEAEAKKRQEMLAHLQAVRTQLENEVIKRLPAEQQRAAEGADRGKVIQNEFPKVATPIEASAHRWLSDEVKKLQATPTPGDYALSVNNCITQLPATHVLIRGNPHAPGAKVEPGFPAVLGFPDPKLPPISKDARTSGRRSMLAEWIASPANPLTARVFVNRVWQYHFGRGIVATPNDFGKFGEKPTHPELLDWLADEFVRGGWSLKRLHRLIMTSSVYRMSSQADAVGLKVDPTNTLLWRFSPRRLTAEEVRDSLLAVSGQLNPKAGGPSVFPPLPKEVLAGQSAPGSGWPVSPPAEAARRSVYVCVKRALQVPILISHDQADPDSSCPVRYTTTVPTQALGMLNSTFTHDQARALARRVEQEVSGGLEGRVRRVIRLTTGREPSPVEVEKDAAFIREVVEKDRRTEADALTMYCLLALNTNEFIYLD